ncbi:MAG TPA: DUF1992 domain-containing protein [Desulfobacteraceae bacterium]|jgi:hypothetical protein|nr:DUF1992 domain-containing protein [Desulfobacteraceae bacterium]
MLPGFEKIIEERIQKALRNGEFDNLPGAGKPLIIEDDRHIPEDLRLAYKVLKNADCLPPEIELKKEIQRTEDLLSGMSDTVEKYRVLKKLNFLIMKLNTMRTGSVVFDIPQHYMEKITDHIESTYSSGKRK